VTRPRLLSLNHFQKTTSSFMTADLSFALAARSKIWTVLDWALSAMTCLDQCMIALSALIGLWMTSLFFLRSTIMTCGLSSSLSFCRTQTNWSDSNVYRDKGQCHSKSVIDDFGAGSVLLTQELKPIDVGCGIVSVNVRWLYQISRP
jgi:hypothetical protein